MAKITGLELVRITMSSAVHYWTSNAKAKRILGYQPRFSFAQMLEEAAPVWR